MLAVGKLAGMRSGGIFKWSLILLIFAALTWALGYGGIGKAATSIAEVLFWVFLALFLISLFLGIRRAR